MNFKIFCDLCGKSIPIHSKIAKLTIFDAESRLSHGDVRRLINELDELPRPKGSKQPYKIEVCGHKNCVKTLKTEIDTILERLKKELPRRQATVEEDSHTDK